jgi:hypothetical protein
MRTSALLALLVFPCLLSAQQDWRFAHPDATLVGGMKPRAVLESPMLAAAIADATKKDPSVGAMVGMASGFLSGVTEIRFSVLDNGSPEPDVVAMVSGKLDDALVGLLSQGKASAKRIDENTLLLGNGTSLDQAALRMGESAAKLQSRTLEGTQVLSGYDFWLAGKVPALPMVGTVKLDLRSIALGMSMHDNVEMELAMEAATPSMAQALIKSAHDAEATQPAAVKGKLLSFVDGSTAHFRLNMPREEAIAAFRAGTAAVPRASLTNGPAPLPAAPPKRNTIRIEGLDSGTLEIPLQ